MQNLPNLLASTYELRLDSVEDVIELLGGDVPGYIFTTNELGKNLFDLKTGILGEIFQKLINYDFPIAIILPEKHPYGRRITELVIDHQHHNCIRFFTNEIDAYRWLTTR